MKFLVIPLIETIEVAKNLFFPVFFGVVPAYHTKSRDSDGVGIDLVPVIVENTTAYWFYHFVADELGCLKIHVIRVIFKILEKMVAISMALIRNESKVD